MTNVVESLADFQKCQNKINILYIQLTHKYGMACLETKLIVSCLSRSKITCSNNFGSRRIRNLAGKH